MTTQIGHNGGPALGSTRWKAHCWSKARQDLLPVLPIEVVRIRVRRAKAVGLDYKTYAGIRATTGRDVIALLFSSNGLGVFRDSNRVERSVLLKLAELDASKHVGAGPGLDPRQLGVQINAASSCALPAFGTSWAGMRTTLKDWLKDAQLPGDAVLMIGETAHEREIMSAGGLAGFLEGQHYFNRGQHV